MIHPTTRVCLTCKRDLPLTEFRANGRRSDGSAYYRHDCRSCTVSPFPKRGAEPQPHPPKPPGECILRECHATVSAADSERVLCPAHLAWYRPRCRCGCGHGLGNYDRDGYRPACWLKKTPEGRAAHQARQAIRLRREKEDRARRRAAASRRAWLRIQAEREQEIEAEWSHRHRLRMESLRAEIEALRDPGGRP